MKKVKKVVQRFYTPAQRKDIRRMLGSNLREARINAGLSQSDVMLSLYGISNNRNRIAEIEKGDTEIDLFLFLLFLDLYGQSADYILGRSCEPINDILAGHINNVRLNTANYLQPIIDAMTSCVVEHIVKIDKDEHLQLLDIAKHLVNYALTHNKELKQSHPELFGKLISLESCVRTISVREAKRQIQMNAQLEAIAERHDKESGHKLLCDLHKRPQLTLPFPEPQINILDVETL